MPRFPRGPGLILVLSFSSLPAFALEPKLVSSVEFSGCTADFPLETKTGQALDAVKLRNDVKAFWRSGRFSDVKAESVEDGDSVKVIFRAQPRRFLRLRRIEVKPPTPGINFQMSPESPIDMLTAQQLGESVRKQMEGSGHPFVKVETALLPAGNGYADLEVRIEQGKRIDVGNVELAGDLGAPGASARKALKWTAPKTMLPGIPGIWKGWRILPGYSDNAVQYDAANLRSFYYTRGYFDADVKGSPADLNRSKTGVRFEIQAGPRYAIRSFNLLGIDGERQIPAASGNVFPVREACKALLDERRKAERAGILDFTAKIQVHDLVGEMPSTTGTEIRKWADLTATIERGKSYRVGRIEFRGNHSFSDQTIRRALLINEAEPLDEFLLRKSLARINNMGFFEPLSQNDVVVNTPPGSDRADLTIQLRERKMRHWYLSGPAGPMSIGGPLQFAIGSRLPPWGRNLLELSTYTASINLMLFAKPLGQILPGFPNSRFVPMLTLQRPPLPGQRLLSGFVIAPQLGWRGMLTGYGISQTRGLLSGVFETARSYTPALAVTVAHNDREGTLYCEPPKTRLDWVKQFGDISTRLVFAFSPF